MKVKVDELQACLLTSPLPQPLRRAVYGGQVTIHKRDCLLVRARTNQGHVGFGAGPPSPNVAQLASCFEADLVVWMEWPDYSSDGRSGTYPFSLAEQMLQTPLSIEQGELILPEGPGLGVKVNETVIRRFPYRTGPCSSFQPTGA